MFNTPLNLVGYNGHLINSQGGTNMSKADERTEIERVKRGFKLLGDTLRRAAKNADALDLKPEAKAWLLDQFGQDRPLSHQPVTDQTLEYTRDIVRQQLELEDRAAGASTEKNLALVRDIVRQQWEEEHPAKPTSGKTSHAEKEQRKRKTKQSGDDLPPH